MNQDSKNIEDANKNIEENDTKTKFKEIVKESSSGLTLLKITATALTAVSMSLISANLTGIINSLILVALISIGTAVISEFYKIILSVTSLGAKKVVAPVIYTKTVKDKNGTTRIITEEQPIITEDISKIDQILEDQENTKTLQEESSGTRTGQAKLVLLLTKQKISRYFKNNPFMRFVLLFAGIAILTTTTSYLVSENNQNTDSVFTTVYKTEKTEEKITESEKQEIIDEAVEESKKSSPPITVVEKEVTVEEESQSSEPTQAPIQEPTSQNETTSTQNNENTYTAEEMQTLINRIEQLEEDNQTLQEKIETLEKNSETTSPTENESNSETSVEDLEEQMRILQEQIDELEKGNNSTNTTSQDNSQTSNDSAAN